MSEQRLRYVNKKNIAIVPFLCATHSPEKGGANTEVPHLLQLENIRSFKEQLANVWSGQRARSAAWLWLHARLLLSQESAHAYALVQYNVFVPGVA